jgi:hypothetical protein
MTTPWAEKMKWSTPSPKDTAPVIAAKVRTNAIRSGLSSWQRLVEDIKAAYAARDWEVLGYPSWDAYLTGEFGNLLPQFSSGAEQRRIVMDMSDAGMSSRAISAATGTSQSTVTRTVKPKTGESDDSPEPAAPRSIGTDGKSYPKARPATPAAKPAPPAEDGMCVVCKRRAYGGGKRCSDCEDYNLALEAGCALRVIEVKYGLEFTETEHIWAWIDQRLEGEDQQALCDWEPDDEQALTDRT